MARKNQTAVSDFDNVLSPKEQLFVNVYCLTLNYSEAARRAYPDQKHARNHATLVSRRPHVRREIDRRLGEQSEWANAARREVIESLLACLRAQVADCYGPDGRLLDLKKMPRNVRQSLAEFTDQTSENGQRTVRVKLTAKLGVQRLLAEMLGMLRERDPLEAERADLSDADKQLTSRIDELAAKRRKAEVVAITDAKSAKGAAV